MDGRIWQGGHLREQVLEEYAFGRLNDPETALVEVHYFHCSVCLEALEDVRIRIRNRIQLL